VWSLDLPDGGNYWDDWTSPDANSDGVVDDSRDIAGDGMQSVYVPWAAENGWKYYVPPVENTDTSETFATIQAAIDDADTQNGHTLQVTAGTFAENVLVNKELSILGSGAGITVVNGGGSIGFIIAANNVMLQGFTITNCGYPAIRIGDYMNPYTGINIQSNQITGNGRGIYAYWMSSSNIIGNEISSNSGEGIFLDMGCTGNQFVNNAVFGNTIGMYLYSWVGMPSTSNMIFGNDFYANAMRGVYNSDTTGNIYLQNNLFANGVNAYEDGMPNMWDSNYFDDWGGIGPYNVPAVGGFDNNPAFAPWP
jgi:parallel beta-helix repeat protein